MRRTPSSSVSKPVRMTLTMKDYLATSDYRSEHFTTVPFLSEINKRPIVSIKSCVSSRVKGICYPNCLRGHCKRSQEPSKTNITSFTRNPSLPPPPPETNKSSHFRLLLSDHCVHKRPFEAESMISCEPPPPPQKNEFLYTSQGFCELF